MMDAEKSSNSSFEDLSNLNEADLKVIARESDTAEKILEKAESKTGAGAEDKQSHADVLEKQKPSAEAAATAANQSKYDQLASEQSKHFEETSTRAPKSDLTSRQKQENMDVELEDYAISPMSMSTNDDDVCDILGNGQLTKRVLQKSDSDQRPLRHDIVTISYTGKLDDGTLVETEDELQIHIGDYEVVQGLDMAIPLMNVGEVAEVVAQARFAYGTLGLKSDKDSSQVIVPAGATITYEVHLQNARKEADEELRSFEARRKYGTRKKERANFWYNRCEYTQAIQLYRRALDYLDDKDNETDSEIELSNSELQTLLEDRLVVYNNLAMAQIKISAFDAALMSVDNVLRCQPNNSKALYRKGRILENKGDTKAAITLLQKAATLEPDRAIQQDLARLFIKARREEHNEKEMYQKMLGQAKKLEQKNKQTHKQQNSENSKLKLLGYLMGSILVGVAGVAIYRYKY